VVAPKVAPFAFYADLFVAFAGRAEIGLILPVRTEGNEASRQFALIAEAWRQRPIAGRYAYVYLDGLWLKRSRGGQVRNVSVLVATGVDAEGFRDVLGVSEGAKEDKASWTAFLRELKERGLTGVQLFVSEKCLGLVENLGECYPEAKWQR
jgi:putative transposase